MRRSLYIVYPPYRWYSVYLYSTCHIDEFKPNGTYTYGTHHTPNFFTYSSVINKPYYKSWGCLSICGEKKGGVGLAILVLCPTSYYVFLSDLLLGLADMFYMTPTFGQEGLMTYLPETTLRV